MIKDIHKKVKQIGWLPWYMNLSWKYYGTPFFPYQARMLYDDFHRVKRQKTEAVNLSLNLSDNYVDRKKCSDTLFILGSGESVNFLTIDQWNVIKKHNTLAFNYFFAHDFVPDYYMIELNKWPAMHKYFNCIARQKYQEVDMFIQYEHALSAQYDFTQYPYQNKLYVHIPYRLPSSSLQQLKCALNYLMKKENTQILYHHSSHTDCAIIQGVNMGYKKIVLVGVDLNGSPYFTKSDAQPSSVYPYNNEYSKMNHLRDEYMKHCGEYYMSTHPTMNKQHVASYHALTLDETIKIYNELILKPRDVQLFVSHSSSLLSNTYPVYFK